LGRNDLGLALYDPRSGGCYDGLQPDRVNENSWLEMRLLDHDHWARDRAPQASDARRTQAG